MRSHAYIVIVRAEIAPSQEFSGIPYSDSVPFKRLGATGNTKTPENKIKI